MTKNNDQQLEKQREHEKLVDSLREVMQTAQGKRFLWWLLEHCGIYSQNVSANSTMYILEGQRSIGLKVIDLIGEVSVTAYPELILDKAREESSRRNGEKSTHVSENAD
jgi:hypothetical protein